MSDGNGLIVKFALADAPASGGTKTLLDTTVTYPNRGLGNRIQRIDVTVYSSHDGAANGVKFYSSTDGVNWRLQDQESYTVASGISTFSAPRIATHMKVTYENSANTLTAFECEVRYSYDRALAA